MMELKRNRLERLADGLVVGLAVSLPWSTSATGILAALWLLAFAATCHVADLKRIAVTPFGGLPILLVAFGVVGMFWADVTWAERANGLSSFLKLLCIPLLFCQFGRSSAGRHVLVGFLVSCLALLTLSWISFIWPSWPGSSHARNIGIPVKDYISQGAIFTVCIFITARRALDYWRNGLRYLALALAVIILILLANIFYIATSRTSLIVLTILLSVFGYKQYGWKGAIGLLGGFLLLATIVWPSASFFQMRAGSFLSEIRSYHLEAKATSAGERIEFWKKSVNFIKAAPVFGHGTGSIREQFRRAAIGKAGVAGEVSTNPHNQVLGVGIQLGFVGIVVLLAMWMAHLILFQSASFAAWIGTVVVVQNIVGSLFNSHLADFTHGWLYVVGVGVAGGVALRDLNPLPAQPGTQANPLARACDVK